jgi:hypothetical protein
MAFMLAVAILLRRSRDWSGARLSFKTIVDAEEQKDDAAARLKKFLDEARIIATPEVLVRGEKVVFDIIMQSSKDADLVFLGMRPPAENETAEDYSTYYELLLMHTDPFPATALVMAGEKMDFHRIFEAN